MIGFWLTGQKASPLRATSAARARNSRTYTSQMQTLQTCELSKTYRGRKVVDDVSISVSEGQVVGLLGPNGAGKTTSFYMIVGLISPDSGSVMLDDLDITEL